MKELIPNNEVMIYRSNSDIPGEMKPFYHAGNLIAVNARNEIIRPNFEYGTAAPRVLSYINGKVVKVKRNFAKSWERNSFSFTWFVGDSYFTRGTPVKLPHTSYNSSDFKLFDTTIIENIKMSLDDFLEVTTKARNSRKDYDKEVERIKSNHRPLNFPNSLSKAVAQATDEALWHYMLTNEKNEEALYRLGMSDEAKNINRITDLKVKGANPFSYVSGRKCNRELSELKIPPTLEHELFSDQS